MNIGRISHLAQMPVDILHDAYQYVKTGDIRYVKHYCDNAELVNEYTNKIEKADIHERIKLFLHLYKEGDEVSYKELKYNFFLLHRDKEIIYHTISDISIVLSNIRNDDLDETQLRAILSLISATLDNFLNGY